MPKIKIEMDGYICNNCQYQWLPRSKYQKPFTCPRCKSARWDEGMSVRKIMGEIDTLINE